MTARISDISFGFPNSFTMIDNKLVQTYRRLGFSGFHIDPTREASIRARILSNQCSFCGSDLKEVFNKDYQDGEIGVVECALACRACANWIAWSSTSISSPEWLLPFVRQFQPQKEVPALTVLAEEVRKNPEVIRATTAKEFELFVGSIIRNFFACEVYHVGKSNDGGIDLLAIESDNPLVIQVKRRLNPDSVEGVDVVRLLFASMFASGAKRGMLVTSAQRFSKQAAEWAHLPNLRDSGFEIDLVAFERLLEMTRQAGPGAASGWETAVSYWRSQSAGSAYFEYIAGPLGFTAQTADGSEKPWNQYTKEVTSSMLLRVPNGYLGKASVAGKSEYLFISDTHREGCWIVPTTHSDPKRVAAELMTYTSLEDHCSVISGADFYDLLHDMPTPALEAVIRAWAHADVESVVTWEP